MGAKTKIKNELFGQDVSHCHGVGFGGSISGGANAATDGYIGQKLAPKAQVSLDQARAIALKARPGAITDQELEKERGGSGLRRPAKFCKTLQKDHIRIETICSSTDKVGAIRL